MGAGSGSGLASASGFNQNSESVGLGTTSVTVPYDGPYYVQGNIMLPTLVGGAGASSLVVTVNQNGSPKYVGPAGAMGFKALLSCVAFDVIAVVLTSSAAVDSLANNVKMAISIGQGE